MGGWYKTFVTTLFLFVTAILMPNHILKNISKHTQLVYYWMQGGNGLYISDFLRVRTIHFVASLPGTNLLRVIFLEAKVDTFIISLLFHQFRVFFEIIYSIFKYSPVSPKLTHLLVPPSPFSPPSHSVVVQLETRSLSTQVNLSPSV